MSLSFPFTTMEEFVFWEDRPAYPWSCFVRLRLIGQVDRPTFETVVRETLKRHPLLCAKARMRTRTHLEWVVQDDPQPIIRWESGAVGGPFPPATHLDLFREIGIRFHLVTDGARCDLTVQWHHACCDAAGLHAFAEDLMIAYVLATGRAPKDLRLPPLEPARLASRGWFGLTFRELVRTVRMQAVGILGIRQFLMRSPVPVLPHRACKDEDPLPPEYPATLSGMLEVEETAGLRRTAAQQDVRLNDLLATELFLALVEWRTRNHIEGDEWLRMMVPLDLRSAADRRLPAVYLASPIFLDRRKRHWTDPEGLLRSVHEEMDLILSRRLGFTFVFASRLLNLVPGALRRHTRSRRCQTSCMFTNVGRLFAHSALPRRGHRLMAGDIVIDGFETVAPLRPLMCVSLAAHIYANRLTMTLHYDPRPLTRDQAADLLDTFLRRLRPKAH